MKILVNPHRMDAERALESEHGALVIHTEHVKGKYEYDLEPAEYLRVIDMREPGRIHLRSSRCRTMSERDEDFPS